MRSELSAMKNTYKKNREHVKGWKNAEQFNCRILVFKKQRHLQCREDVAGLQLNNNQILASQYASSNDVPMD